jgi:hypothetical protein
MYLIAKIVDIEWRKIEREISYPKANAAPWDRKKFEIKETDAKGKGAFATEKISKGELIIEFEGQRVSRSLINQRIANGEENIDDPLQIDDELFIVLDNSAYYFNHSCDPNSAIKGDDKLIAIRDVEKGEEITYDYSATVGANITSWTMKCKCGSANCRKNLGNIMTIPKEQLDKYLAAGGVQRFIRKQLNKSKNVPEKWRVFYKISSIVLLVVGVLSLLAGLLSKYGPHIFYNSADFFPIVSYQIGYGIVAIVFFLFTLIAKNFIAKIIWWICFAVLSFAFLTLLDTDPFNIQQMIGRANTPKTINVEFMTETEDDNGNTLKETNAYGVDVNSEDAAPIFAVPVEF